MTDGRDGSRGTPIERRARRSPAGAGAARLARAGCGLMAALVLTACGGAAGTGRNRSDPVQAKGSGTAARTPAGWPVTACGTYSGRGCAPAAERVDLEPPTFSHPTEITNPLFPISRLRLVVLLGQVDGKPFRSETTLLPRTDTVAWNGQEVEVVVSQYAAYLDGRLDEVAVDRYAQADDGSVWYFGEDVFDYRNGAVAITEGTWLTGRDGPPAMIMPADPAVGDVFRPENVLGVVFEEVTVTSVGKAVDGPRGPVAGAMVGEELHLDGATSNKVFAPGYGEFFTGSGRDVEALALAVPADAIGGPPPSELAFLSTSAWGILENARLEDWVAASATVGRMSAAWDVLQAADPPPLIAERLDAGLSALSRAVRGEQVAEATQAAIDVAQSALDLELRYRPPAQIDVARFHLWSQQLRVHAAANDLAGVTGAVAALEWIRDRVSATLSPGERQELDARLRELRGAADAENLGAAADHAARLAAYLRGVARP